MTMTPAQAPTVSSEWYHTRSVDIWRSSGTFRSLDGLTIDVRVAAKRCVPDSPCLRRLVADAFPRKVLKAYETQGFDMLVEAFNDYKYLEKLTGLDKLHEESAAALESMESVEWDEDEGEDF